MGEVRRAADYNQRLSERRNTKPDGSDDPKGRAQNRRVEIVIPRG